MPLEFQHFLQRIAGRRTPQTPGGRSALQIGTFQIGRLDDPGRAALDAMITQQAQIIAYTDDYKLLMIATLVVIPLLIVFKQASDGGGKDHTIAVE